MVGHRSVVAKSGFGDVIGSLTRGTKIRTRDIRYTMCYLSNYVNFTFNLVW